MKIDIDFKEDDYFNQTCCVFRFKELSLDFRQKTLIVIDDEGETVTYNLDDIESFSIWEEKKEE